MFCDRKKNLRNYRKPFKNPANITSFLIFRNGILPKNNSIMLYLNALYIPSINLCKKPCLPVTIRNPAFINMKAEEYYSDEELVTAIRQHKNLNKAIQFIYQHYSGKLSS